MQVDLFKEKKESLISVQKKKFILYPACINAQIKIMIDVATCMPNHYLRSDWLRIAQIYGVPGFVIAHLFYLR